MNSTLARRPTYHIDAMTTDAAEARCVDLLDLRAILASANSNTPMNGFMFPARNRGLYNIPRPRLIAAAVTG